MKTITVDMTEEQIKDAARQLGMVESRRKVEKPRRFRARLGEPYWFIDGGGIVMNAIERGETWDNYRYISGSYFKTEEEAQAHKDKILATQRIEDKLIEFGGNDINWENDYQFKYSIEWYYGFNEPTYTTSYDYNAGVVYTTNIDAVKWVVENMKDDIKLMLGVK